ncbi:MAG: GNAT family N-acetyltransferase [Chitinophagaceae bacterium]
MLFCKPSRKSGILYEQSIEKGQTLSIRSLKIKQDLPVIQRWAMPDYWPELWSLPGGIENVTAIYQFVQRNAEGHSFVGLLDEHLICVIDLFAASSNDVGNHLSPSPHDCMIRFLQEPPSVTKIPIVTTFLHWYFHFPQAGDLLAGPGITNYETCRELEALGFVFYRNIMLAKKAASIYVMSRKRFESL